MMVIRLKDEFVPSVWLLAKFQELVQSILRVGRTQQVLFQISSPVGLGKAGQEIRRRESDMIINRIEQWWA